MGKTHKTEVTKVKGTETLLGDIAEVFSGYAFSSSDFCDAGIPVIKIANIRVGSVSEDKQQYLPAACMKSLDPKYQVKRGDILISLTGSQITQPNSVVGRVARYRSSTTALLNQRAGKVTVKNEDEYDPTFLYYVLFSPLNREKIAMMGHGAASQANVSPTQVKGLEVPKPQIDLQRKIGSVLSAYDDLIENNSRRIAILEEMARRIYEEWFVKFRFPGHENVKMVESELGMIPEGWDSSDFDSLAQFINGYAFKTSDWSDRGRPIIKIAELKKGITEKTPRFCGSIDPKYDIVNGDILFSWSGDIDVYVWNEGSGFLNQHLFKVVPNSAGMRHYFFYTLKSAIPKFRTLSGGTTLKHIKRSALHEVAALIPKQGLIDSFEDIVSPIVSQIASLRAKNTVLVTMRDLLIPRLVSADIDVSDFPDLV